MGITIGMESHQQSTSVGAPPLSRHYWKRSRCRSDAELRGDTHLLDYWFAVAYRYTGAMMMVVVVVFDNNQQ
eukprot:scaffold61986_cov84-Attheya_sp.AAC.1